jgi:hypothetical protein
VGASATPVSATMQPVSGAQAWYTVQFWADSASPSTSYHPHITLASPTTASGPEFLMSIYQDCSGNLVSMVACTDNGASGPADVLAWESQNTDTTTNPGYYTPIPTVGNAGQVLIEVFHNPAVPVSQYTCTSYTLSVSD